MELREEGKFFHPLGFQQTKNMKGILLILVFMAIRFTLIKSKKFL